MQMLPQYHHCLNDKRMPLLHQPETLPQQINHLSIIKDCLPLIRHHREKIRRPWCFCPSILHNIIGSEMLLLGIAIAPPNLLDILTPRAITSKLNQLIERLKL
jgi:hypothetical protein